MSSEHEKWNELLPWYANGTLDERTQGALEAHLRDCPTCRRDLANWRRIVTAVRAQPSPALSPSVRRRLLSLARPQPWKSLCLLPLLLRFQLPIIRAEIWPASALVFALGLLVTLASDAQGGQALPFVLTAPLVAAIGVAFLYGPVVDPALEVELATPTPPWLVLMTRLLLVFGFDLALGLVGSLALALLRPDISLWPLVTTWLAPMSFLSALSLLFSVLSADPGLGMLVSLVLWSVQTLWQVGFFKGTSLRLPDMTVAATRPWLWALALLMGGLALWASERDDLWLRGRAGG
jgi:hypothetical protein